MRYRPGGFMRGRRLVPAEAIRRDRHGLARNRHERVVAGRSEFL
jgi:hypothetical protein